MLQRHLALIVAPMVNQSDLPFRILVRKYGASLAYTQMLMPDRLLNDQDYLEYHIRDLTLGDDEMTRPVVVQLCGNNVDTLVRAGRKELARDSHFGAYLLGQKDWPLVQDIVSGMSHSLTVPVAAKLRLCQPAPKTLDLAQSLEASGISWVTLHARTVSARRRRQGAADLNEVKRLKDHMHVPIISNGNVRVWGDIQDNLQFTGADGVMIGESLLGNPCLFVNAVPDPVDISLEYLGVCRDYPGTATIPNIQTHIRHFIDFQCARRPWFQKFRAALGMTTTIEEIEALLSTKVERWRGKRPRRSDCGLEEDPEPDDGRVESYASGCI